MKDVAAIADPLAKPRNKTPMVLVRPLVARKHPRFRVCQGTSPVRNRVRAHEDFVGDGEQHG